MAYKDSLTLYEELIATGTQEAQAKTIAHQMGDVTSILVKIEKDLMWMRVIGAAMVVAFMANFFR
jgi:hypothetical protein